MANAKAYASNISPGWPLEAQKVALADAGTLYIDEISKAGRNRRLPAELKNRATMLRPTGRLVGSETITVQSLRCLAWTSADLVNVLAAASARHATIVVLEPAMTIPPVPGAQVWQEAVEQWQQTRSRLYSGPDRKKGFQVSIENRAKETARRIALIREDWPKRQHPTKVLLERAAGKDGKPMAVNTAVLHLGKRPQAQRRHDMQLERLAEKVKRDAAEE